MLVVTIRQPGVRRHGKPRGDWQYRV